MTPYVVGVFCCVLAYAVGRVQQSKRDCANLDRRSRALEQSHRDLVWELREQRQYSETLRRVLHDRIGEERAERPDLRLVKP